MFRRYFCITAVYNLYSGCIQKVFRLYTNCIRPEYKLYTAGILFVYSFDTPASRLSSGRPSQRGSQAQQQREPPP